MKKIKITEAIKQKRIYFDGGMGTVLQEKGLKIGELPEEWNLSHPDIIADIHRSYLSVGCDVITTNTFGVNPLKYENYAEYIKSAINCAKSAAKDFPSSYIAFDVGPTGKLLKPLGDLSFEDAVSVFAKNIRIANECGADLVIIETMTDSYETKAAVLAAKENCDLPVFVTNAYDESGKLMTGATPEAMIAMLEGMGVDALGMNCSFGPDKMLPLMSRFMENASIPIIVNPNAGLPEIIDGKAVYAMSPEEFSDCSVKLAESGANILGGCCGTTPDYIAKVIEKTKNIPLTPQTKKNLTVISSYTHSLIIGNGPVLIGERINPTGKPKLKEALRSGDMNYILSEGIKQSEKGVHILDVNVGLPEIDEADMMKKAVTALQAVTDLPLQIDTANPEALEGAMRIYNGKPLINSVNGNTESMDTVFPLVKKYGGCVIALTLDKDGIPNTSEGRIEIAERIIIYAKKYGLNKNDLIFDPLALTVSSDPKSAITTLDAVEKLTEMGCRTSLGVSNISFGLPCRNLINATFYANALAYGLSCAIMNPFSTEMMGTYYSFRALNNLDTACSDFIAYASENAEKSITKTPSDAKMSLKDSIIKGLASSSAENAREILKSVSPLDIINNEIIPALNEVGKAFEEKKTFLPQLLMSADAASAAFSCVKEKLPAASKSGDKFIIATVKGDIHDIGKNIVKVLLESYGFLVYDLGKDVPPETVLEAVKKYGCRLVGLSALMTTTVPAMEETIKLLHSYDKDIKVVVGGAVLNQEYADMIHADAYSKDAMETVRYAERYYGKN